MKYLVVETECSDGHKFTHFIELRKEVITAEVSDFVSHLSHFRGQRVVKCYFSNSSMSNW